MLDTPLRVLHVIPALAARYGGPSQAALDMVRALRQAGVEALIATTDADGPARLRVPTGQLTDWCGVPALFFPCQWSDAFKYSHPLAAWLVANVECFDVVHIHAVFSHASLAAAAACRRQGVPYVVRPLGSLDPWSLRQKRFQKRLLWHLGVRQMLHGAAAIHYTTAAERRLAEAPLGLRRGVVIPLGVDDALRAARPDPSPFRQRVPALGAAPYVLALSRLHPKKGLDLLIDAFRAVTRTDTLASWRLVLAGDGEPAYVAHLQRRADAATDPAGRPLVLFTGWLDAEAKAAALAGAGLLALPSRQENFALAVVEALALGVPVLVSDRVNLADEIAQAGAGWVTPLDAVSLHRTLAEALAADADRARRGATGRALVQRRFTWPAIAAQLTRLYRCLVKAAPRCP